MRCRSIHTARVFLRLETVVTGYSERPGWTSTQYIKDIDLDGIPNEHFGAVDPGKKVLNWCA
jgi:hypothetical protein